MSSTLAPRGVRALVVTAVLACSFSLLSASAAEAHTLTAGKARKAMLSFAKGLAQDLADEGQPVTRYGAGDCKRRNAHSFTCVYLIEFNDGETTCGNVGIVSFRSSRSRALKIRFREDPQCFDADGNPLEKKLAKLGG